MTRRLRRIFPNIRLKFASPFYLLKCCRVEQVQFLIVQVVDGVSQVFGQDMPLRFGFGFRICGGWCWRGRSISHCTGREEVWRSLLTTVASHDMIMAIWLWGSNVSWEIIKAPR